jgi:hypothetical protein
MKGWWRRIRPRPTSGADPEVAQGQAAELSGSGAGVLQTVAMSSPPTLEPLPRVTATRDHLGAPGIEHAVTIEEPPADEPAGTQLPLI